MTSILLTILNIYSFILLIRVLMTWIPNLPHDNPIVNFFFQVTEPLLKPIRNMLPPQSGIDFSPLVLFLIISVLSQMIVRF